MNEIQTKVFCPSCGKETELLLEKQDVPDALIQMMRSIGVPVGNETVYKGEEECSCGNVIGITFIIEAFPKGQQRPDHKIIMMGGM